MALVGGMLLSPHLSPFPVGREEGVGLGWGVVHLGQAKAVGALHRLTVYTGASYHIHILVGLAVCKGLFQRTKTLATLEILRRAAEHDVAAVGQCPFGQRLKGLAAHDDGVASGELLKPLQVFGQPVYQAVLVADGEVLGHGSDDVDAHGDMGLNRHLASDMGPGVVVA